MFIFVPYLLKSESFNEDNYWYLLILVGVFIPIENIISFLLKEDMYGSISVSFTKTSLNDESRRTIFAISLLIYIGFLLFLYITLFFLDIRK